jgi:hypothetical protein
MRGLIFEKKFAAYSERDSRGLLVKPKTDRSREVCLKAFALDRFHFLRTEFCPVNAGSDKLLFPCTAQKIIDILASIPGMLPQSRFDAMFRDPEFVDYGNGLIYRRFWGHEVVTLSSGNICRSQFFDGLVQIMGSLMGKFADRGSVLSSCELEEIGSDAASIMAGVRLSDLSSLNINERWSCFGGLLSKLKYPGSFEVSRRSSWKVRPCFSRYSSQFPKGFLLRCRPAREPEAGHEKTNGMVRSQRCSANANIRLNVRLQIPGGYLHHSW